MSKHIAIYVRVSSKQQKYASQEPDLKRYAAQQDEPVKFYHDKFTGKTMNRPGWSKLETALRAGKISKLVVWKLDRLGRNARGLLTLFDELQDRNVDLVCTSGGITGLKTPEGRLMAGIIAMFAEYDNELRSERILSGQADARAKGTKWGGSKKGRRKVKPVIKRQILRMKADGETIMDIHKALKLSRPTIYSVLKEANE